MPMCFLPMDWRARAMCNLFLLKNRHASISCWRRFSLLTTTRFIRIARIKVRAVRGPSNRRALNNGSPTMARASGMGDRLFIYFTGHGGPGRPDRNTTMAMWEDRSLNVTDFSAMLDRLSPKVQVVLLMVQCHAGGFADVDFPRWPAQGRAWLRRGDAVFLRRHSTVGPPAAPPMSTKKIITTTRRRFLRRWAERRGPGSGLRTPDYDGNGRVSLAEAHAYVLLHSDTIELPLTTSDVLLRQFSRENGTDLVRPDGPFDELIQHASPTQRAILEGLSDQLELKGNSRTFAARNLGRSA